MMIYDMSEEELAAYSLKFVPFRELYGEGPDGPVLMYKGRYSVVGYELEVLNELIEEGADDVDILSLLLEIEDLIEESDEDNQAGWVWWQRHPIKHLATSWAGD